VRDKDETGFGFPIINSRQTLSTRFGESDANGLTKKFTNLPVIC
jgi:hypothetical protein